MARPREPWNIRPARKSRPVTASLKAEVEIKANDLIVNVLKPRYVKPPRRGEQFNHITDILWRRCHNGQSGLQSFP